MSVVKKILKVMFGHSDLYMQDKSDDKNLDDDCWDEYFSGSDILAKKVERDLENSVKDYLKKSYEENPQSKCQIYYFEDYR